MFDENLLESIAKETKSNKLKTDELLTKYYVKQGRNSFKSSELAFSNINNFLEFTNANIICNKTNNTEYLYTTVTKEITIQNPNYFEVKNIYSNLVLINWRDFEFISASLLRLCFRGLEVNTSQATADGGVDFEGKIAILSAESKQTYGFIQVYGQSKRYSANVGIEEIKQFVAFANSKKRNYTHFPQLFLFFTTSDFAKNSRSELNNNGFIGLSGLQIASLIYNNKNLISGNCKYLDRLFVQKKTGCS